MSHLPLDARAILQHLNELGFRNISAEQLREFLKGMQPQSDRQSASKSKTTTTTTRANPNPQQPQSGQQQHQKQQPHQRSKVKVIKSKRPLCYFKFYLDICDHQLTKRIETEIKALGGTLEFFLNDSITHFITDKDPDKVHTAAHNNSRSRPDTPQTPNTPNTPQTPNTPGSTIHEDGIGLQRRSRQTRADAILNRVRAAQQQNTPNRTESHLGQHQHQLRDHLSKQTSEKVTAATYTVWKTEHALRFFQRIQTELQHYLQGGSTGIGTVAGSQTTGTANIHLKGSFIKIESIKRNHRPYYHLIKQPDEWPKIDLGSEDGAFRLQAKADVQSMTRKSLASRSSQRQQDKDKDKDTPQRVAVQHAAVQALKKQSATAQTADSPRSHCRGDLKESSDKQCGVCEICKIEYDTLTIHLQSKDHELFAKNTQNFHALDTLIQVSASVNGFLKREEQQKQQLQYCKDKATHTETYSDMEVDELLNDSGSTLNNAKLQNKTDVDADALHLNITNSSSNNNNNRARPSPVLREKSKRITKGKHSSEKFQASPNTPPNQQTPSPNRKVTAPCSLVELHRMEQTVSNATTTAATPTNPTRRKTQNSVLSPPIRAMLPPSSLYKVVEASDAMATPPRNRRGVANAASNVVDSPSLIVKFQKVRQSELQRLNGEAENFMFPRTTTRSSSELPTDVDRQTTSDIGRGQHSISSASLDSTSEAELAISVASLQRRATAIGRRRKGTVNASVQRTQMPSITPQLQSQTSTGSSSSNGGGGQQQRFPSAPIQPEIQPQLLRQRPTTATRKSSRMATAIVTAATTSSQLQLRRKTLSTREVQLEDRMGELTNLTTNKETEMQKNPLNDEDDDDESNDESSISSGSDEDYVASGKLHMTLTTPNRVNTREERAARRLSRLTINLNRNIEEQQPTVNTSPTRRRGKNQKAPTIPKSKQSKQQTTPTKTKTQQSTDLMFDCSKSERISKLRYAFEEFPSSELWHRVFQRQDAGEEHYYSYYGSTRYRKLPYELGPIPMERTKSHSCTICRQQQQQQEQREMQLKPQTLQPIKLEQELETDQIAAQSDSNLTAATTTTTTTSTMYKHKKLHLLQRYQQEQRQQQEQQSQQTLNTAMPIAKCDSKASTPELLEREFAPLSECGQLVERVRAASMQSSSSSSCGTSQKSGATCRNKQLVKIAELPPRKSPREHASTLALVSCIIRQRQDSQSKTNSEAEEPSTPTLTSAIIPKLKAPLKLEQESVAPSTIASTSTLHNTRSQAATPVEELRFATEISETVKRMRRGQNKYDTLPSVTPIASERTPTPSRCRRPTAAAAASAPAASYTRRIAFSGREVTNSVVLLGKRKRRQIPVKPAMRSSQQTQQQQQQPSGVLLGKGVRKLPSKKGILEYEMENSALKTLDTNMKYVNPMLIAWQIDKYLELTGREYDLNVDEQLPLLQSLPSSSNEDVDLREEVPTPPPTDCCFTSDFDLCDLLVGSAGSGEDDDQNAVRSGCRRSSRMNLYSYQRKRKCLKSNRTGWPRVQRRRATGMPNTRSLPGERFNFREASRAEAKGAQKIGDLKQETLETEEEQTTTTTTTTAGEKEISKEQDDDNAGNDNGNGSGGARSGNGGGSADKEQTAREDAVMTPPATDLDEQVVNEDESVDEPAAGADNESQADEDDNETMADSVDQQQDDEAEIEATDADVEEDDADDDDEDDDDDDDDDVYEDAYGDEEQAKLKHIEQDPIQSLGDEPSEKRARIITESSGKYPANNYSPSKKPMLTLQNSNGYRLNATSTPTTQPAVRQQHRRTPLLNGSLGSCISPSEKLGDNSDIFTVSSDGLDTDMDLSNTQTGDSLDHCPHQKLQPTTPKRKFDISKYAPPNNGKAASSCAAEAATAAVKSLAISQFLKKEVRVTCRRLRAPFRRFRYRR